MSVMTPAHVAVAAHDVDSGASHVPEIIRQAPRLRRFRGDVEGLRALAVLAVLAFHADVPHLAGGFVGVDVFFVISGFLITGLLLDEHERTGRVSLAAFYARRARRILPAAAVVLVATVAASWWLLTPLRRVDVIRDVLAAAGYAVNWRFITGQTDYLAAGRDASPLLHYWSLAVEEQFYLVWPLLLIAALLLARLLRCSPRATVAVAASIVGLGSFALAVRWTWSEEPLAYLGSPSRAWQFAAGALLAVAARSWHRRRPPSWLLRSLGWLGLACIVGAVVSFGPATLYPGWAALLPTAGGVALIASGSWGEHRGGVASLLTLRPVRALGRLSYSLYLWHWPVLVLAEARLGGLSWTSRVLLSLAAVVPAFLTMRLVEDPVRLSSTVSSRPFRGLSLGLTALVVPVTAALLVGSSALDTMDAEVQAAAARAERLRAASASLADPLAGTTTRGAVTPAAAVARKDTPHYPAECIVAAQATSSPSCVIDPVDGSPAALTRDRVVLIGDSHAGQWFPTAAAVARKRGWDVEVLNKSGCPLPDITVVNPDLGRSFDECAAWRTTVLARLANEPAPRLVLMSSLNGYVQDPVYLLNGWRRTLASLSDLGAPLVYLADTPFPNKDMASCISGALSDWSRCALPRTVLRRDPFADAIRRGRFGGVLGSVDINSYLCPPGATCPAVRNGVLLYRDTSHVTDTAMTLLAGATERQLIDLKAVGPATSTKGQD
jgi:peptidoglycan/LPS O-acetylase OafA/YrhL